MALIQKTTLSSGVTGDYWKITNLEIDKISNFLSVTISCYLNKDTRDKGLNPFTSKKFILKLSTIDLSKNILDEVYKQIKISIAETDKFTKVVFFENAIDA